MEEWPWQLVFTSWIASSVSLNLIVVSNFILTLFMLRNGSCYSFLLKALPLHSVNVFGETENIDDVAAFKRLKERWNFL